MAKTQPPGMKVVTSGQPRTSGRATVHVSWGVYYDTFIGVVTLGRGRVELLRDPDPPTDKWPQPVVYGKGPRYSFPSGACVVTWETP